MKVIERCLTKLNYCPNKMPKWANDFTKILTRRIFTSPTKSQKKCGVLTIRRRTSTNAKSEQSYKIEPLPDSYAEMGEGPHWDVATQSLYYVDINAAKLLRYDYEEDKVYKSQIKGEKRASFVVPLGCTRNKFAVGCCRRLVTVPWNGVASSCEIECTLFKVQQNDEKFSGNRFNDAKCDPCGRLFAGTMRFMGDKFEHRYGELYKFENGGISLVKTDCGIANGLAWNEKDKKFYFIDTADYEVKEYDYDIQMGVASNPKVIYDFRKTNPKDHLLPDGMTIDTDGNIYVATFNGHSIYKIDPRTRKVLLEIKLPVKQVTSCAFGGPNLDILFATSSSRFGEPEPAGTVFKVTGLGVKGLPMLKMQF